jgi:hypothetical protein
VRQAGVDAVLDLASRPCAKKRTCLGSPMSNSRVRGSKLGTSVTHTIATPGLRISATPAMPSPS